MASGRPWVRERTRRTRILVSVMSLELCQNIVREDQQCY